MAQQQLAGTPCLACGKETSESTFIAIFKDGIFLGMACRESCVDRLRGRKKP